MSIVRTTRRMLLLAVLLVLPGCAAAYHDYPCGCVPYAYCPPPPLPYVTYSHCGCPTPIVAQRQGHLPESPANGSDRPIR